MKSDWPRWRRGVIYNHINPFVFYAGLGHCHSCPRGESRHLTCKLLPINIRDDEPFLYLHSTNGITPAVHQCPSWPFEHNEMATGRTLVRSEIWAPSSCLTRMSTYRFTGSYWVKLVTGQHRLSLLEKLRKNSITSLITQREDSKWRTVKSVPLPTSSQLKNSACSFKDNNVSAGTLHF